MLHWALIFFAVALVAAVFVYSAAGAAVAIAEVVFFGFLVLAIAMLVAAIVSRRAYRPSRL